MDAFNDESEAPAGLIGCLVRVKHTPTSYAMGEIVGFVPLEVGQPRDAQKLLLRGPCTGACTGAPVGEAAAVLEVGLAAANVLPHTCVYSWRSICALLFLLPSSLPSLLSPLPPLSPPFSLPSLLSLHSPQVAPLLALPARSQHQQRAQDQVGRRLYF